MANFLTDLKNTIFKENVDSIYELTEFSIDTLLSSDKVKEILKNNNELIKEFPIIKTIIGVKNTAQTIHNINLLRQTYMFVLAFNSGTIDKGKLVKYQKTINSDKKKADKELGKIIIILNKTIEEKKVYHDRLFI